MAEQKKMTPTHTPKENEDFDESAYQYIEEEEEEEDYELCKNCDSTYTGKKEPFCIMGHKNCDKGLPHITTLYEEQEEVPGETKVIDQYPVGSLAKANWEGRGGGICLRKVINWEE